MNIRQMTIDDFDAVIDLRTGMEGIGMTVYAANAEGRKFWNRMGWNERPDLLILQHMT